MKIPKIFKGWDYWNGKIYKDGESFRIYLGNYETDNNDYVITQNAETKIDVATKKEIDDWLRSISGTPEKCFICGEKPITKLGRQDIQQCANIPVCKSCLKDLVKRHMVAACPPWRKSGLNVFPLKRHDSNCYMFLSNEEEIKD